MKAFRSATPSDLARFDADPQRQQLFNVELPGVSHFGRRLDRIAPPGRTARLRRLSEKLLHRLMTIETLPPRA